VAVGIHRAQHVISDLGANRRRGGVCLSRDSRTLFLPAAHCREQEAVGIAPRWKSMVVCIRQEGMNWPAPVERATIAALA